MLIARLLGCSGSANELASVENTFYHADPQHLWNRLNQTLFERTAADGTRHGLGQLDILYWSSTRHLLTTPSHRQALAILDEFIADRGEKLIRDPLPRALLQRDLWELFDWSTQRPGDSPDEAQARRELQWRLTTLIRRVALTTNEIASLPDNYQLAEQEAALTNLPHGLFQPDGDWIALGLNGSDPAALAHVTDFGGRSVFLVLMRHPEGRKAGVDYLNRLRDFVPMWIYSTNSASSELVPSLNPNLPQFPTNTQWALVRRLNVIDADGQIRPSRVVESIQVRTYLELPQGEPGFDTLARAQRFAEFVMARRSQAALVEVRQGERGFAFVQFRGHGIDPFEFAASHDTGHDSSWLQIEILKTCATCHGIQSAGIHSVHTFTRLFSGAASFVTTQVADLGIEREAQVTIGWKQRQFDWGLLQGLWSRGME